MGKACVIFHVECQEERETEQGSPWHTSWIPFGAGRGELPKQGVGKELKPDGSKSSALMWAGPSRMEAETTGSGLLDPRPLFPISCGLP